MIKYIIQRYEIISRKEGVFGHSVYKCSKEFLLWYVIIAELIQKSHSRGYGSSLKIESFDDITTIKIAKEAGISRSSFYIHYKDKFELIDSCQQTLFNQVEYIFEKHEGNKEQAFLEIFEFLKRERLLSALISANGTREFQAFIVNKVRIFINTDFQNRFGREELSPLKKNTVVFILPTPFLASVNLGLPMVKRISASGMTNLILKLLPI